jgi:hypothetical protein
VRLEVAMRELMKTTSGRTKRQREQNAMHHRQRPNHIPRYRYIALELYEHHLYKKHTSYILVRPPAIPVLRPRCNHPFPFGT